MKNIIIEILSEDLPINTDNVYEWMDWINQSKESIKKISSIHDLNYDDINIYLTGRRFVIVFINPSMKISEPIRGPIATIDEQVYDKFIKKYQNYIITKNNYKGQEYYYYQKNQKDCNIDDSIINITFNIIKNLKFFCYCISKDDFTWPRVIKNIMILGIDEKAMEKARYKISIPINKYTYGNRYIDLKKHIINEKNNDYHYEYKSIGIILEYAKRIDSIIPLIDRRTLDKYKSYIYASLLKYEMPKLYKNKYSFDISNTSLEILDGASSKVGVLHLKDDGMYGFINESMHLINVKNHMSGISMMQKIDDIKRIIENDLMISNNPKDIDKMLEDIVFFEDITFSDKINIISHIIDDYNSICLFFVNKLFSINNDFRSLETYMQKLFYTKNNKLDMLDKALSSTVKCDSRIINDSVYYIKITDIIISGAILLEKCNEKGYKISSSADPYGIRTLGKELINLLKNNFINGYSINDILEVIINKIKSSNLKDKNKYIENIKIFIGIIFDILQNKKDSLYNANIFNIFPSPFVIHQIEDWMDINKDKIQILSKAFKRLLFFKDYYVLSNKKASLQHDLEIKLSENIIEYRSNIDKFIKNKKSIDKKEIAQFMENIVKVAISSNDVLDNLTIDDDDIKNKENRISLMKQSYNIIIDVYNQ